ncbi:MAG: hypothetical protein CO113_02180 [Elusimicrobia bacterium CG_4_9_14_3_um_filter_62_55]|nr:MAG: hypothetical protein COR54_06860 [Elusimicrobia bacterium CG22_combo_CG10-13_8_21_14_all_63_91]PJA13947.1 MAG: hypothetical protein COX66_13835 [Elusimicrobia bacterium CG_4_10_14_0_2_um_filter_63_34]PJB26727.1 MAG: hypothetical protein CO113_02180 [Elusimicrobia bacterium CG_4_9_14_3_um_filter_62_55]
MGLTAVLMMVSGASLGRAGGPPAETVYLLHGMGRTRASMLLLSLRLEKAGYRTVNFRYSQTTHSLDEITERLLESVERDAGGGKYHLIGHSLGNIVIRNGFKTGFPPGLGRIVMLAPPNRPAALAARFKGNVLYHWITGDSGQKLSEAEFYDSLPVPSAEFAVIAGTRGTTLLSGAPNDGIVLVESTKLAGMKDFAELRHAHTFIMNARDTFELCRRFLSVGTFSVPIPGHVRK